MTTIAVDAERTCMAGDGRILAGTTVITDGAKKVARYGPCVVGMAGDEGGLVVGRFLAEEHLADDGNVQAFVNALCEMKPDERPDVLILLDDGELIQVGCSGYTTLGRHRPAAIGSGADAAVAAMMCGLHPTNAILVAGRIDVATGGEITQITL